MSRSSRVPPELNTSREVSRFFDRLDKRRLTAIADLAGGASSSDIINKINEILDAMRNCDAMES